MLELRTASSRTAAAPVGIPKGVAMSKSSTQSPPVRRASATSGGWFVWTVGFWVTFFVLMNAGRLDDVAAWIPDLPILLEILAWLVFFPWVLATAVWTSNWSEGLRMTLVVLFAIVWILVSIPRPKPSRRR
jgi:hypothetical protein